MTHPPIPFETFPPLDALPFLRHAFSLRTTHDTRRDDFARRLVHQLGYPTHAAAEQPHGPGVAIVETAPPAPIPGVDALLTRRPGLPLVIRCADCAPVFLVDRRTPAIALIHAGKKGIQAGVIAQTRQHLNADFAFIGPSIGPCHYEVDLWTQIERQLAGVAEIHNPRLCTACHLDRYFSYRAEKGRTGRMFAVLCLR
jgi:copper oxidase (laccase) domain-containing protein